jgi:protein-disulfide isomerase
MPQLMKNYVDTGKLSIEIRDFPLTQIHTGALMAAQAANCSAEQGQFFLMRKTLFDGVVNKEWQDGSLDDLTTFGNYAAAVGIDRAQFESCVTTNRHLAQIKADIALAQQLGINSTPAFIINGRLLMGAQPYTEFAKIIDTMISPP